MRIDAQRGRQSKLLLGPGSAASTQVRSGVSDALRLGSRAFRVVDARLKEAAAEAEHEQDLADRVSRAKATAAFRVDAVRTLDEGSAEFDGSQPGFADSMAERLEAMRLAAIGRADSRIQGQLDGDLAWVVADLQVSAARVEQEQRRAYRLGGIRDVIDDELTSVGRDPAALNLALENIDRVLEAAPGELRGGLRQQARAQAAEQALAWFEDRDPEAGLAALQEGAFDDMLSAQDVVQRRRALKRAEARRVAEAERAVSARQRQAEAAVRTSMADMDRRRSLGLDVPEERWEEVTELARAAGPELTRVVTVERQAQAVAASLATMPLREAAQAVSAFQEELGSGGSQADLRAWDVAQQTLKGMREGLRRDPLKFAAEHRGGIQGLDLSNPLPSLRQRIAAAQEAADHYGVPVRYFTDEELASVRAVLDQQPQNRALFIDAVAAVGQPAMLAELAPRQPELAHLAGITMDTRGAAATKLFVQNVLSGLDARAAGQEKTFDANKTADEAAAFFGDAAVMVPSVVGQARAAAEAAYDAASMREGRRPGDRLDRRQFRQFLAAAMGANDAGGGVATIGNGRRRRRVVLPSNMTAGQFENAWRRAPDARWREALNGRPVGVDGQDIPLRELRGALPVAVAPGLYALELRRGELVDRQEGGRLLIDVSQLALEETEDDQ